MAGGALGEQGGPGRASRGSAPEGKASTPAASQSGAGAKGGARPGSGVSRLIKVCRGSGVGRDGVGGTQTGGAGAWVGLGISVGWAATGSKTR